MDTPNDAFFLTHLNYNIYGYFGYLCWISVSPLGIQFTSFSGKTCPKVNLNSRIFDKFSKLRTPSNSELTNNFEYCIDLSMEIQNEWKKYPRPLLIPVSQPQLPMPCYHMFQNLTPWDVPTLWDVSYIARSQASNHQEISPRRPTGCKSLLIKQVNQGLTVCDWWEIFWDPPPAF